MYFQGQQFSVGIRLVLQYLLARSVRRKLSAPQPIFYQRVGTQRVNDWRYQKRASDVGAVKGLERPLRARQSIPSVFSRAWRARAKRTVSLDGEGVTISSAFCEGQHLLPVGVLQHLQWGDDPRSLQGASHAPVIAWVVQITTPVTSNGRSTASETHAPCISALSWLIGTPYSMKQLRRSVFAHLDNPRFGPFGGFR